ncbi:MAG: helix-turn-helix domain-containing protein, partial [Pseudonocardiaceae bacterium]
MTIEAARRAKVNGGMRTVIGVRIPGTREGFVGQIPRELTPYVSVRHFFGAELRRCRLGAGLSHDRLGALINYSGDLIGKVEKAERAPTAALAEACDELLSTGGWLGRLVSLIEALAQQESAARTLEVSGPQRPVCGWLLAGQAPTVGE